jgi:hypothetical protein
MKNPTTISNLKTNQIPIPSSSSSSETETETENITNPNT